MQKLEMLLFVLCVFGSCVHVGAEEYHEAYLCGYPDGSFRAEQPLTRQELAMMLYRLLPEQARQSARTQNAFADVVRGDWAYTAISAVTGLGVIAGEEDAFFEPEKSVSERELTQILRDAQTLCLWPQLSAPDGLRDDALTRARAVAILNQSFSRQADDDFVGAKQFWDVPTGAWYRQAVTEAANAHTFVRSGDKEIWTGAG